tara:strand:+ start:1630 stop:2877 length:1248 start_codon:yes stop_codon:yes gene_type:complete
MSFFYASSNQESTKDLFNKRILYIDKATKGHTNVINFNIGEKALFGRMGIDYTPIIPRAPHVMKNIRQSAIPAQPRQAINFVVDIFNEMMLQFRKCIQIGNISPNDPFLSELSVYKAYTPAQQTYAEYQTLYFDGIAQYFVKHNIYVKDFEDFRRKLMEIAPSLLQDMRMTFPGYVKSKYCSIMSSGLALEIADNLDYTNNEAKVQNFVESKNWQFFVNTCNTYGFMIDYNVPWRIVADIDSVSMRAAALRYGYTNRAAILIRAFRDPSPLYFWEHFSNDLLVLYNRVRKDYWPTREECKDGTVVTHANHSKTYTSEALQRSYGILYFFKLYVEVRLLEERPEMSPKERQRVVDDLLRSLENNKITLNVFRLLEGTINKEFDKVGSYSYINRAGKKIAIEMFEKGPGGGFDISSD